jgi:hypothetical protein
MPQVNAATIRETMKKEYGWLDYANFAVNVVQSSQLSDISHGLARATEAAEEAAARHEALEEATLQRELRHEARQREEERLRQLVCDVEDKGEKLEEISESYPAASLIVLGLYERILQSAGLPRTFSTFEDKDRFRALKWRLDSLQRRIHEKHPKDVQVAGAFLKFFNKRNLLATAIRTKERVRQIEAEREALMRDIEPDVAASGHLHEKYSVLSESPELFKEFVAAAKARVEKLDDELNHLSLSEDDELMAQENEFLRSSLTECLAMREEGERLRQASALPLLLNNNPELLSIFVAGEKEQDLPTEEKPSERKYHLKPESEADSERMIGAAEFRQLRLDGTVTAFTLVKRDDENSEWRCALHYDDLVPLDTNAEWEPSDEVEADIEEFLESDENDFTLLGAGGYSLAAKHESGGFTLWFTRGTPLRIFQSARVMDKDETEGVLSDFATSTLSASPDLWHQVWQMPNISIHCEYCGTKIDAMTKACTRCGKSENLEPDDAGSTLVRTAIVIIILIGIGIAVMLSAPR